MALNRDQEDLIALKVIHAFERAVGSKIPATERAKLKQFEGAGHGIALKNGCGELVLEARRMRVEGLEFRLARQSQNGCLELVKQWLELATAELKALASNWGRKGLPVKLSAVTTNPEGQAIDQDGSVSLDRDRGG